MRIKKIYLQNFRGYNEKTIIDINNMLLLVGKNDHGKSTILEALDVFFNNNKGVVKITKEDLNKTANQNGETDIIIGVVLDGLPTQIVIDDTNKTSFEDEYLLNSDGFLELFKVYKNGGTPKIYLKANHPTNDLCNDLLSKKITELRKITSENNINCDNSTKSAVIRKAIWQHFGNDLTLQERDIEVSKIKEVWEKIENYLPLYTLFQSDRKNSETDSEVQDPMKLAVKEILKEHNILEHLEEVSTQVKQRLEQVASSTLDHLREMNPDIANVLNPVIPDTSSLKWADVYKSVTITSDDDISFEKRGSGIKRMILINFFRAEADRRKNERNVQDVIYAIEEPETSQHPDHQKKLIRALTTLANSDKSQVIMTTHSPNIVKLVDLSVIKLVSKNNDNTVISDVDPQLLAFQSVNELNYIAFDVVNEEYHNELYEYLLDIHEQNQELCRMKLKDFDRDFFCSIHNETATYPWMNHPNEVSLHTFVRNQIHHRSNNGIACEADLKQSIEKMRQIIISMN